MVNMSFKVLSALLCYPSAELQQDIPNIRTQIPTASEMIGHIEPLMNYIETGDLIELQEQYVMIFDRNPSHSLHLFEHIHGEDRARGQAMVDLLDEYRQHGFDVVSDELPDYIPLFLEFLSVCAEDEAIKLLDDAIHVLAHVGKKLQGSGEIAQNYAGIFDVLQTLATVEAQPLTVPPIRDMDEALETFGPNPEGIEPLLKPSATTPIYFYDQRPSSGQHRA